MLNNLLQNSDGTDNNDIWMENFVPRAFGRTSPTKTTNI